MLSDAEGCDGHAHRVTIKKYRAIPAIGRSRGASLEADCVQRAQSVLLSESIQLPTKLRASASAAYEPICGMRPRSGSSSFMRSHITESAELPGFNTKLLSG